MKIWYFGSLLFFILSLSTLIEDRYEVTYESKNKNESFGLLICISLKEIEIYSNRSEIDLNLLNIELYEYLNRLKSSIKKKFIKEYENLVLKGIKRNNYLITRGQFCFPTIKADNKNKFVNFGNIFLYSRLFYINWDTYYMVEIEYDLIYHDILIVLNRPYPYSNCTENYSKFECLNKCFKEKNRLSKYWYGGDETDGIIKLNYDKNNQILKENEGECFKECKREDCKLVYILPIRKVGLQPIQYFEFIEASPLISSFDYWVQLIGLFVLFSNICFYQIYSQLISKINFKLKKEKHRRYMTMARYATLILVELGFLSLFIQKVVDFKKQHYNLIRRVTTYRSIELNPFSIVFCVDMVNDRNEKLSIIEQETNTLFSDSFEGIYLDFENKRKRVNFTLSQKIFFFEGKRCFHLVPHLKEIRYQSLFTSSKLTIQFRYWFHYDLYLIPNHQNFNSKSYLHDYTSNYIKKITKRSKLENCVNYVEFNFNFRSRWDSVDRCIRKEYFKKNWKFFLLLNNRSK